MNNGNNGLPQGVITNQTPPTNTPGTIAPAIATNGQNLVTNDPKKNNSNNFQFSKKHNGKLIVVVILLIIVCVLAYMVMTGKRSFLPGGKKKEENKIVEVDVGSDWGNKFAIEAQKLYEDREIDVFDIAFIDVDLKDDPEMIIKFTYKNEKDYLLVYSYDKNSDNVRVSKLFSNASLKLLYSLEEGYSTWYLFLQPVEKYGNYFKLAKIVAGTVYQADIKANNDREVNEFRNRYVTSNYDPTFYQVKQSSFEENFKTMYERNSRYADEIKAEQNALNDKYKDKVKEYEDVGEYLMVGSKRLTFGAYTQYVDASAGVVGNDKYSGYVITLNRNRTLNMNGNMVKFSINNNIIMLDDGTPIKVLENDTLYLSVEGGVIFKSLNPYVSPEEQQNNNNINNG